MMTKDDKQAFYNKYYPILQKKLEGTGIFPEVAMSQMILESNWGKSKSAKNNNFFGIKGTNELSKVYKTKEQGEDGLESTEDSFNGYASFEDAVDGYINFLSTKRYNDVVSADTPEAQIQALKDAGYATDANYVPLVTGILNSNVRNEYIENEKSGYAGMNSDIDEVETDNNTEGTNSDSDEVEVTADNNTTNNNTTNNNTKDNNTSNPETTRDDDIYKIVDLDEVEITADDPNKHKKRG